MTRKRGRHTGRFEPGETFAAIPVEVMRSPAYAALPDYAARVLYAIAGQFRGQNNGNLSLSIQTARELGIRSAWKVQAGLRLLLEVGLIEMTRPGKYSHGRGICALFALTWKKINPTAVAFPPIDNERPAPNTWAGWHRPGDWEAREAQARRAARGVNASKWNTAHDHSQRGEQASSQRGEQGKGGRTPTNSQRGEQEGPCSSSQRGGSLLDSGRGCTQVGALSGDVCDKIRKLLSRAPELSDDQIAHTLRQYEVAAAQVARVRQS